MTTTRLAVYQHAVVVVFEIVVTFELLVGTRLSLPEWLLILFVDRAIASDAVVFENTLAPVTGILNLTILDRVLAIFANPSKRTGTGIAVFTFCTVGIVLARMRVARGRTSQCLIDGYFAQRTGPVRHALTSVKAKFVDASATMNARFVRTALFGLAARETLPTVLTRARKFISHEIARALVAQHAIDGDSF